MASKQNGDTLVEVLLSIVILSAVIVGAITMMTRGLSASQNALEHTKVQLAVSGQTEILRYLRDAYLQDQTTSQAATWSTITNTYADNNASTYGNCAVSSNKRAFYLTNDAIVHDYAPTGTVTSATVGNGLWIESTRTSGISPAYVDFQIRACWNGLGGTGNQQTITSLRLYDPSH